MNTKFPIVGICSHALICYKSSEHCYHQKKHRLYHITSCEGLCGSYESARCIPYNDIVIAHLIKSRLTGKKIIL